MSSPQLDLEKHEQSSGKDSPVDVNTTPADPFEVTLEPQDDPKRLPLWRKWVAALIINAGAICVTGASAMVCVTRTTLRGFATDDLLCIGRGRRSRSRAILWRFY